MDSMNYYIKSNYQNSEPRGTNKMLGMCKSKL